VTGGLFADESSVLLKRFFQTLRSDQKLSSSSSSTNGPVEPNAEHSASIDSNNSDRDSSVRRFYLVNEEDLCGRGYTPEIVDFFAQKQ